MSELDTLGQIISGALGQLGYPNANYILAIVPPEGTKNPAWVSSIAGTPNIINSLRSQADALEAQMLLTDVSNDTPDADDASDGSDQAA